VPVLPLDWLLLRHHAPTLFLSAVPKLTRQLLATVTFRVKKVLNGGLYVTTAFDNTHISAELARRNAAVPQPKPLASCLVHQAEGRLRETFG